MHNQFFDFINVFEVSQGVANVLFVQLFRLDRLICTFTGYGRQYQFMLFLRLMKGLIQTLVFANLSPKIH